MAPFSESPPRWVTLSLACGHHKLFFQRKAHRRGGPPGAIPPRVVCPKCEGAV